MSRAYVHNYYNGSKLSAHGLYTVLCTCSFQFRSIEVRTLFYLIFLGWD